MSCQCVYIVSHFTNETCTYQLKSKIAAVTSVFSKIPAGNNIQIGIARLKVEQVRIDHNKCFFLFFCVDPYLLSCQQVIEQTLLVEIFSANGRVS